MRTKNGGICMMQFKRKITGTQMGLATTGREFFTGLMGLLIMACLLLTPGTASAQQAGAPPAQSAEMPPMTAVGQATIQSLTPAQQGAVMQELGKTGGQLTPGAAETLKARPEFQGLSPAEVARGKELLQRQEAAKRQAAGREAESAMNLPEEAKQVIGDIPKGETLFDRAQATGKYQDITLDLKPFGYDFFREAVIKVVTDSRDIPIPMKYVVGPGDEVRIALWGRVNANYNLTIDRDGKVSIPNIGPIVVAGMTFEQMSSFLMKQVEKITGTNVDVSLGALRTIPIFVLGDVKRPGSYTIGSFATITDALLLAGGPTEIGSMRNVQLRRKNNVVQTFDLYDLLLKGDKSKDITLTAGDIVFVPVIGPYVGVAGNVRRPALYELRGNFSLEYLFEIAGGLVPTAYTQQIQVERTIKNEKKIVVDIDDKNLARASYIVLQDADLVKVFSIVDKDVNVVYLNGNVKKGGKYALTSGMRIRDILKDEQDLLPETYFDYALIKRSLPQGKGTALIPLNLGDLLLRNNPASNLELLPQDNIYIFTKWFFQDKPSFTISGEVRSAREDALKASAFDQREINAAGGDVRPAGDQALKGELAGQRVRKFEMAENFKVKDAILTAGGLTENAYLKKGEIVRVNKKKEYQTLYFNVARAMTGDPEENLPIQDEDQIIIHSIWEDVYKRNVTVEGEVLKPGVYQLTEQMTVKDLIFKSGNVLESAYLSDAEISTLVTEGGNAVRYIRKNINLQKALAGDPGHNVLMQPYDRLFVKRIPDWQRERFVTVTGEIMFPGRYIISKGEKITSLIDRAGGYKETAYLRGAFFTRERVRDLQQKSLIEMADRMERDLLGSAAGISTAISSEEIAAKNVELEQKRKFIDTLRKLKATGRMTVYLTHTRLLKGSEYDIELEEGDTLLIPPKNSVVNVAGVVMSPTSLIYSEKMSYQDYINETGGYGSFADTDNIFVMKVDGSARKLGRGLFNWSSQRQRWEVAGLGEKIPPIEPGDTIVVPAKVERIAWLREIRDITQILMNTSVAAAVILNTW